MWTFLLLLVLSITWIRADEGYMGRLGLEVANGLSRMKLNGQRGLGWCTGCASWPMPRVWVERLGVIWNGWV